MAPTGSTFTGQITQINTFSFILSPGHFLTLCALSRVLNLINAVHYQAPHRPKEGLMNTISSKLVKHFTVAALVVLSVAAINTSAQSVARGGFVRKNAQGGTTAAGGRVAKGANGGAVARGGAV